MRERWRLGITDWQLRHREVARTSRNTDPPQVGAAGPRARRAAGGAAERDRQPPDRSGVCGASDVPLVGEDPRVHLTVPREARLRQRSAPPHPLLERAGTGDAASYGVVVTSPGRTWMDLAAVVPPAALLAVTDQMLARGFPEDEFPAILRRRDGSSWRGGCPAGRHPWRTGGPVRPWSPCCAGCSSRPGCLRRSCSTSSAPAGWFVGQVDMAWPDRRVLVEFDGERPPRPEGLRRRPSVVRTASCWRGGRCSDSPPRMSWAVPSRCSRAILAVLGPG